MYICKNLNMEKKYGIFENVIPNSELINYYDVGAIKCEEFDLEILTKNLISDGVNDSLIVKITDELSTLLVNKCVRICALPIFKADITLVTDEQYKMNVFGVDLEPYEFDTLITLMKNRHNVILYDLIIDNNIIKYICCITTHILTNPEDKNHLTLKPRESIEKLEGLISKYIPNGEEICNTLSDLAKQSVDGVEISKSKSLKEQLEDAIKVENYELAIKLRDQIAAKKI